MTTVVIATWDSHDGALILGVAESAMGAKRLCERNAGECDFVVNWRLSDGIVIGQVVDADGGDPGGEYRCERWTVQP